MLRIKNTIPLLVLVTTVSLWSLLGWRLLAAGGVFPATVTSSWHGLARRSAWAHWVSTNGVPSFHHGDAQLEPARQYEIAVQPISFCSYLRVLPDPADKVTVMAKDRPDVMSTDRGFATHNLPRTFDGYHFLIATSTAVTVTSFQFICRP